MAVGDRVDQYRAILRRAVADLFDQKNPFGRLALTHVFMLAGDTLVTVSLAGSLFFSISPHEAKSKVFLYLVLTLAPFAVVSPLLGPLIDRSRGARRAMAVSSAVGRAIICPFMAAHTHTLLLFPSAFLILVLSKLYLVTRGALVPEMARGAGVTKPTGQVESVEYAALNARLTLLGTLAGFVASIPGVILLKTGGSPAVLIFDAIVFLGAAVAASRLTVGRPKSRSTGMARRHRRDARRTVSRQVNQGGQSTPDASTAGWDAAARKEVGFLQPMAHPEVLFGLFTMAIIRGLAGFFVFLLAFGLRQEHVALWWYGLALGASGIGAIVGLILVARLRQRLKEQHILLLAVWLIAIAAAGTAYWGTIGAQVLLAFAVGVAGSLAQPSFDAIAQRYVPAVAQGRAFARFATRQQLVWVIGAIIPVEIHMQFAAGDVVMAAVAGVVGFFYVTSRRSLRHRAIPREYRER